MVTTRPPARAIPTSPPGLLARLRPPWPIDRWAGSRAVQTLGWFAAAAWAGAFPLVSDLRNQVFWGTLAGPAYALAGLLCLTLPRRIGPRAGASVAVTGAVVLPLVDLALGARYQSEVMVVERSAWLLLHTGSPYLPEPAVVTDYNPYLPAMALFGLPHLVLGSRGSLARVLGDPRIWFALAFIGCLYVSWRLLTNARATATGTRVPLVPMAVLTASPLIALALTVGGVDLPLIGVCCLAMALAARGRTVATGLVLALACTLKWTAWPALPVALLLIWRLYGRRPAGRAAGVALAASAAVMIPSVLHEASALRDQVVRFPLGLAAVHSPAGSPLPGKVLADLGPVGHTISLILLTIAGFGVALWLLAYPPSTAVAAGDLLAGGLTVAFVLAPAGRFGYLALPTVLVIWPRLATGGWTIWQHPQGLDALPIAVPRGREHPRERACR